MAQALKEKALEVALLEQEVRQLRLLLELQQALIPSSEPVLADTPLLVEDDWDHPVENPQVEDHPQEDLEVQVVIHPEHQDLPHQYPRSKEANNPLQEQLLRAKDPKVRCARVCITAAGLVLQGIAGSEHWPLDALV